MEELDFALRKEDNSSKRRIMRNYGFRYDSGAEVQELLAKPENFSSSWNAPDLTLSWSAVDDATGYYIQFASDGISWQSLSEVTENSYVIQPPANNRYYRVCAVNEYENGEWSITIQFDPPNDQNNNM
jgi:hypothetical protein